MSAPRQRLAALLRRYALGLWLGAIALVGVAGFRSAAMGENGLVVTPTAWLWLVGSTVTGVVSVLVLLRALHRRSRSRPGITSVSRGM